jgi:riboflavin kinase
MTGYSEQLNQRLGFDPYPGTLNLKLSKPFEEKDAYAVGIDGFWDERGCFGPCKCYPATIEGIRCAVIRPEHSRYPLDIIEVIAHVNLRKTLDISEADEVDIILE